MARLRGGDRGRLPSGARKFPLSPAGPGREKPPPKIIVNRAPRWALEIDQEASTRDGRRLRFKVRKPRLPWTPRPRKPRGLPPYTECGRGKIFHHKFSTPEGLQAAIDKRCGPKRTARTFDPGGAEAGTLAGARRVEGLFDHGWGQDFPLTRREQEAALAGKEILDPFFAPPTTPHPDTWIEDKLQRLRGKFAPTRYTSPKGFLPFCPQGGFAITCAGPDGEVGWSGGTVPLTPLDVKRFTDAYCAPGQCQEGGKITPPAGYTEFVRKMKPRNAAVRLKASCQPKPALGPVIMDYPPEPSGPAPAAPPPPFLGITKGCPAGHYWAIGLTGIRCVPFGANAPPASAENLAYFGIVVGP